MRDKKKIARLQREPPNQNSLQATSFLPLTKIFFAAQFERMLAQTTTAHFWPVPTEPMVRLLGQHKRPRLPAWCFVYGETLQSASESCYGLTEEGTCGKYHRNTVTVTTVVTFRFSRLHEETKHGNMTNSFILAVFFLTGLTSPNLPSNPTGTPLMRTLSSSN